MKRNQFILATCMMVAMLACTNDEEFRAEKDGYPTDNVIRVTTNVSPNATATVTRAGYETSNLEEFGFFVNNTISSDYTYNNIKMVKTDGVWKATIEDEMYWMSRLQPVTVVAYAPYQEGQYTTSSQVQANVLADQSTADNLLASDFIGMKKEHFMPKTGEGGDLTDNGQVAISMQHLMSKIRLSIEYPKKFNLPDGGNPITHIKINGFRMNAVCDFAAWKENDLSTAIVALDGERAAVTPYEAEFYEDPRGEGGLVTYECILVPQYATIEVEFTIGGISYKWVWENEELKAGNMLKIDLKIVGRKLELNNNVSVDDWEEGESEDITGGINAE